MGGDLQIGKGLVVLLQRVEAGLHILDQPAFQQQGVDLAVSLEVVDVTDFLNQVRRPAIKFGRLEKVAACTAAEILGFANVNHPAGGIFHQVDAGRLGKRPHFPGGRRPVAGHSRYVGICGRCFPVGWWRLAHGRIVCREPSGRTNQPGALSHKSHRD